MSPTPVLHPNFRIPSDGRRVLSRKRALMFATNQETFDLILNEVDQGRAASSRDVIARALERYLDLPAGSADLNPSES